MNRGQPGIAGGDRVRQLGLYPVCDASGDHVVGTVTSGALSPTLGYPIALAYVDAGLREPGTELTVDVRGRKEPFVVTPPPFYRRG